MKAAGSRWLAVLLLSVIGCILQVDCLPGTPGQNTAPYGAYLGCFNLARMLYMRGVEGKEGKQYTNGTIRNCMPDCKSQGYSLSIITPDYRCWCSISTPLTEAQLPEGACFHASSRAAAVFYFHELAGIQKCKLAPIDLTPGNVDINYNGQNVIFEDSSTAMTLQMDGTSGTRVVPKDSSMLYGQVQVTAIVNGAPGAVTAFYLRDSDDYNPENKGVFDEIDFEFLNGNPAVPSSVWLNVFKRGVSGGEHLIKPGEYQKRLNLGYYKRSNNTFLEYTISWQPSRVMWAMEGVPILTRKSGQEVKWTDMKGKQFARNFSSPDKPMHISFSIWSDQSRYQFGGQLDWDQSPFLSQFVDLKRIICDEPITAYNAHVSSVRGPAWLYIGTAWDWNNGFVDSTSIQGGIQSSAGDSTPDSSATDHSMPDSSTANASTTDQDPEDDYALPDNAEEDQSSAVGSTLGMVTTPVRHRPGLAPRPAPPPSWAAKPGNYSGFVVAPSLPKKAAAAPDVPLASIAPDGHNSSSSSSTGSTGSTVPPGKSSSTSNVDVIVPQLGSSGQVGGPTSLPCKVAVVPYGVCGGVGNDCRGRRCRDAPWPGHCCKNGLECTRKSAHWWSCEPPKDCPRDPAACEWQVQPSAACGGKGSSCVGCQCRDAQWPGFCCAEGFKCTRQNQWYWSCQ